MNLPDWTERVGIHVWLGIAASILIGISIIYNDEYIVFFLGTFLYCILGFSLNNLKETKLVITLETILLIFYSTFFIISLCTFFSDIY